MPAPTTTKAAGIIWIVFGGIILANLALLMFVAMAAGAVAGIVCAAPIGGLIGGVFIHVGVQTIGGKAKDTLQNGIGSVIFGALIAGQGILMMKQQVIEIAAIVGIINLVCAGGLITAGVLSLMGRSQYQAWVGRKSGKKKKRKRPRTEEEYYDV